MGVSALGVALVLQNFQGSTLQVVASLLGRGIKKGIQVL